MSRARALIAIVAAGALLRVLAARGELWLDEIWSLGLARAVRSPLQIFTAIHHDNNHYLNTLYLWAIPTSTQWFTYRLLSVAAGVVTVWLAGLVLGVSAARSEKSESRNERKIFGTILVAGSFWLVLYSSEARGYALAVCFAFAALYASLRFFEAQRWTWAAGVAVFSTLGFLSHLTYLEAFLGLVAWSGHRLWHTGTRGRRWMETMAAMHGLPVVIMGWLYVIDIRGMTVGGGPRHSDWAVVRSTLSLTLGGPVVGGVIAAVVLACAAVVIWRLARRGSDLWVLFLVTVLISPALTLAIAGPAYVAERYFLIAVAFMLLAFALALADLAARAEHRRLALSVVALYIVANLWPVARVIRYGRGSYLPALQWMAGHSDRREVLVGSSEDLANGMLVRFYSQFVPGVSMTYLPSGSWPANGPEWILLSSQSSQFDPPTSLPDARGNMYELTRVFPSAPVSGFTWALYHNRGG